LNQIIAVLRGKVLTNLSFKKKGLLKKQKEGKNALQNPLRKSVEGGEGLEVRAYLIILLVLIPYFLCVTGVTYQMFDVPRAITLNSEGKQYDLMYVHDIECYSAKWLKSNAEKNIYIYSYPSPWHILISSGNIPRGLLRILYMEDERINGYIYLRYYNVVNGKVLVMSRRSQPIEEHSMEECKGICIDKKRIYDNGGSEIWR
jgi:uncharacterized membrane protein